MVKTYKIGYELDMSSGSSLWHAITANDEYYLDIPFNLYSVLQYYEPNTPCKILLEHMFLYTGGSDIFPDSGIKLRLLGLPLEGSYNIIQNNSGQTFQSFDVLGEAVSVAGKNSSKTLLYISREVIQPDHDWDLYTSTSALQQGGPFLRVAFKRLPGSTTNFTPSVNTKLDLCLAFVVMDDDNKTKNNFIKG